jgi:hypothetical protein
MAARHAVLIIGCRSLGAKHLSLDSSALYQQNTSPYVTPAGGILSRINLSIYLIFKPFPLLLFAVRRLLMALFFATEWM